MLKDTQGYPRYRPDTQGHSRTLTDILVRRAMVFLGERGPKTKGEQRGQRQERSQRNHRKQTQIVSMRICDWLVDKNDIHNTPLWCNGGNPPTVFLCLVLAALRGHSCAALPKWCSNAMTLSRVAFCVHPATFG